MKTHRRRPESSALILIVGLAVCMAGCATTPPVKSAASYQLSDVDGTWSWEQNFDESVWHGEFVLKKDGDSCSGTLDDVSEGTFGDKIKDVTISENQLAFRREGAWGVQHWQGTLEEKDGRLQIVDGRWTKEVGASGSVTISGSFTAEKKD